MARPRLGEEERRGRTVGVRVTEAEVGRAAGAEPDRGESQSDGVGDERGSRVVAGRDPGGGGACGGTGG